MNEFLKILLSLSFSGAILIFAVFAIRFLFKKSISKQWQYYIWLIVIARLLLPFAPETNLIKFITASNNFLSDTIVEQKEINLLNEAFISNDKLTDTQNIKEAVKSNDKLTDTQNIKEAVKSNSNLFNSIIKNAWLIWLMIATIFFIRKITIYQSFIKYIKAGKTDIDDIEILEKFASILK